MAGNRGGRQDAGRVWGAAGAPGEEIEARGMTRRERAARLDQPPQVVNEISRGEKVITPYIAIALGKAMYGEPGFRANLEADYRLVLARLANRCRSIQPACPVGWRS